MYSALTPCQDGFGHPEQTTYLIVDMKPLGMFETPVIVQILIEKSFHCKAENIAAADQRDFQATTPVCVDT